MSSSWKHLSDMPAIEWPALHQPRNAIVLALLFQLERSQWAAPERIRELQVKQFAELLQHAYATVPFYRERWSGAFSSQLPERSLDQLAALPLLSRRDLQDHFDALKSERIPPSHGATAEARTSGSTGSPVRVLKTELCNVYWRAFNLRDHAWHRRELTGELAAIRHGVPVGEFAVWGEATKGVVATGPSIVRGVGEDIDSLLDWLHARNPQYFATHPSLAAEMATRIVARGLRFPALREVRLFGELLSAESRAMCREAWQVPVTDTYSANEIGYLALQCPLHEHYHVQSEGVVLEVLDEQGNECAPGTVGRVVVTALHNFAMPLVRYDIGDYAEVGEACPCGRGLPVLKRIVGRVRNMLVTADGKRYWPGFGSRTFTEIAPVTQYQLVQKTCTSILVRLVTAREVTASEEERLRTFIQSRLPPGFDVAFEYPAHLQRSAGGKFEDFICEVPLRGAAQ